MSQPTRIVIIGGGYTGIWGYRFIRRSLKAQIKKGAVQITVICPKDYHSFHGFTAEALCGILSINNRQSPLRLVMPDVQLIKAHAESINLKDQTVRSILVGDERVLHLPYNHLLIANGSYDMMEAVPGMRQHGWSLKEPGGVLSTRNHLIRMLELADSIDDPMTIQAMLTVVVGGGGLAGVELAANIAEFFQASQKLYPVLKKHQAKVILVHSGNALLPQLRPQFDGLADYATREFLKYPGAAVQCNVRLSEVKADGAKLSDGSFIPSKTVLSTIGQRTIILPGTEQFPRTRNGLIVTDEFLHVQGQNNIWVAGDAAQVLHPKTQTPVASNALWAMMAGERVGRNMALAVQGKPLKKFAYNGLGQAASLGVGKGASELLGIQIKGWLGWWLRFFFFMYFVPSRRQMIRILLDWLMLPVLGRYQTSMESVAPHALATKRAKESTATMEIPALVVDMAEV